MDDDDLYIPASAHVLKSFLMVCIKPEELERLRAIEAAVRAVTIVTPLDYIGGIWQCWYCIAISHQGEAPKEHEPGCPWQALKTALVQGE